MFSKPRYVQKCDSVLINVWTCFKNNTTITFYSNLNGKCDNLKVCNNFENWFSYTSLTSETSYTQT
jgi:hypothetical protein